MALNRENAQPRNGRQTIFPGATEPRTARQTPAADVQLDWPLVRVVNHRQTTAIGRVLTAYFNNVWSA
jgi:hypothetical protein